MKTQSLSDGTHNEVQWNDVQGLLRTGYGNYPFSQFIRIELFENISEAAFRSWLRTLLSQHHVEKAGLGYLTINHADFEHTQSSNKSMAMSAAEVKLNIAVSVQGLQRLGLPSAALNSFPLEFIDGMGSERSAVLLGDLGNNHYTNWDWGGTHDIPHLVILAYCASEHGLDSLTQQLRIETIGQAHVLPTQRKMEEHFGFRDGLSNPEIRRAHRSLDAPMRNPEGTIEPGEFIFGYPDQRGLLPISPTTPFASDPDNLLPRAQPEQHSTNDIFLLDRKDLGHNGSFLVIRQLEQDTEAFEAFVQSEGADKAALIGAKMMGRWKNGTPLTLSPLDTEPEEENITNHFQYQGSDSHGERCPIGAHIRRANPRDGVLDDAKASFAIANRHRILRRGRLYEEQYGKGLLFMCLNVNIARQFEHIQSNWINNTHFAQEYETDPIVGSREIGDAQFTIPATPTNKRLKNLPDFVTVKGGSYFFLPSLNALRFLCT